MSKVVLVTGSRNWSSFSAIYNRLKEYPEGTIVVHGGAPGADNLADLAARELGFETIVVRPEYDYWAKKAGKNIGYRIAPLKRNIMMLEGREHEDSKPDPERIPDAVEAFKNLDSKTNGTAVCIREAERRSIPVNITYEGDEDDNTC